MYTCYFIQLKFIFYFVYKTSLVIGKNLFEVSLNGNVVLPVCSVDKRIRLFKNCNIILTLFNQHFIIEIKTVVTSAAMKN